MSRWQPNKTKQGCYCRGSARHTKGPLAQCPGESKTIVYLLHPPRQPPHPMSVPEDSLEERLRQRRAMSNVSSALEMEPIRPVAQASHGNIPNTPLASSLIAFVLGSLFTAGSSLVIFNGLSVDSVIFTRQLGFFIASWALFHWLEFVVTAGWNREKCSVDCECIDVRKMELF